MIRAARNAEKKGNFGEAERLYRRSVQQSTGGGLWSLRAENFSHLGNLYRLLGRYRPAESMFRRALSAAARHAGAESLAVCAVLNQWGVLLKYSAHYEEAERLYRRALQIGLRHHAGTSDIATIYHNLGGLEHARGRYARGERFARRAVDLRQSVLGATHPLVAADEVALAAILVGRGRHDEAERLYRKALRVFRKEFRAEHYDIAVTLNNLATLQQTRGRLAPAARLYRRALEMKERLLGTEHVDVALTLNNLAVLQRQLGQHDLAFASYERALGIFKKTLPSRHPKRLQCQANYQKLISSLRNNPRPGHRIGNGQRS